MTVKLRLPPGFYHNGTDYQAAGRWHRGNLMRWCDGGIKPINGWRRHIQTDNGNTVPQLWTDNQAPRGGIVYNAGSSSSVNIVIGTNEAIYEVSEAGVITDVTPAGFIAKPLHAVTDSGYGAMAYGRFTYGTARPSIATRIQPIFTWGFSTWGFWPIACARGEGYRIMIKKDTDARFVPIAASPIGAFDAVVTDERFLMTFGKFEDHLLIEWSDREDYADWVPVPTNEAGFLRLNGSGRLMRGVVTCNRILVLGEAEAFVGQYVGPPYVYGFDRIADGCGLVAANAVAVTEQFAIWLGKRSFWIYDGSVRELPCEVFGYFFADVNQEQISKIWAGVQPDHSEIWFLYQSKDSATGEHDSYVIYNYALQIWYFGKLDRALHLFSGILRYPIMVTPDGYIYDHDLPSTFRGTDKAYIETGPLEGENGQRMMGFSYVYPDLEEFDDAMLMRLSVRDMPSLEERHAADYILLNPTSTMGIMGRAITMKLTETRNHPSWVVGDFRVEPVKMPGPQR